jgi:Flp pilus assembly protein TadD
MDEAVAVLRRAIELSPDYGEAHNNLGIALQAQGMRDDAVASYRRALELRPDTPEILNNLGTALQEQARMDEAVACYRRAIEVNPAYGEAHNSLGAALQEQGRPEEAADCYRRAIALKPDHTGALNNLGTALQEQGLLDEAASACRRAIDLNPNFEEAHNSLGTTLVEQGQLDEAVTCYRRALALNPNYADAHCNLAMALLARGNLAEGWAENEWRWKTPQMAASYRDFGLPRWRGEAAEGKTLLVHGEQGFGDNLQFCRYAPLAAARGLRVVLEVSRPLVRLMRGLPDIAQVVTHGEALPPFDLHCPMLSLPLALGTDRIEQIPNVVPYLHADPAQVAAWRTRLAAMDDRGVRVGIVWAGNPREHMPSGSAVDRRRSIGPGPLAPLFDVPGVHFISLQKGGPAAPAAYRLTDFMAEMDDFADTAALVANLDLVISVDTSVAHLSAALGRPVWLLDRFDSDWRWLVGRADSPWYPTLLVFRQPGPGDWRDVVEAIRVELAALVSRRGEAGAPAGADPPPVGAELHPVGAETPPVGAEPRRFVVPREGAPSTALPAAPLRSAVGAPSRAMMGDGVAVLFASATREHQAGRLAEAEARYRDVLALDPDHADSLHLLGVVCGQTGRHALAVDYISRAVALQPREAAFRTNLGVALRQQQRLDEAALAFRAALELNPGDAEVHINLGIALKGLWRLEESAACLRTAIALRPDSPRAHNSLGNTLREQGMLDEAAACYRRALDLQPDYQDARDSFGDLMQQGRQNQGEQYQGEQYQGVQYRGAQDQGRQDQGRQDQGRQDQGQKDQGQKDQEPGEDAAAGVRAAPEPNPGDPVVADNWAGTMADAPPTRPEPADRLAVLRLEAALRPDDPQAQFDLGVALKEQGQIEAAVGCYRRALALQPDYPGAHNNLGNALRGLGRLDEAVASLRAAVALQPDYAEAHNNLGIAWQRQGRLDAAIDCYRRSLALNPDIPEVHNNLAMALLARGDLAAGWAEYEWRWKTRQLAAGWRDFARPQWAGEPADGRTLLIHAEQGFGDTLQFCRYAPLAAARGLRVVLEVQPPLVRLLRGLPGIDRVVAHGEALPDFDLHCPMLSLPLAFGTTLGSIPADVPYLHADAAQAAAWGTRVAAAGEGVRIGLAWAGNPSEQTPAGGALDRRRSIDPGRLAPFFAVPGLRFFSLQKDGPAAPADFALTDVMPEMGDFADTAALVANLDLVVSVDTAVAHLAAALGKPVWLLDRFDPDWRWLFGRRDSPWYPTLRIYRQPRPGDWDSVLADVARDLRGMGEGREHSPPC